MGKVFAAGVAGLVSVIAGLCLADEVSVSATLRDSSVIKGELKTEKSVFIAAILGFTGCVVNSSIGENYDTV